MHIALSIITDPDTGEQFAPGSIVPDDVVRKLSNVSNLYASRLLFNLVDDPVDEPVAQWQTWGGSYPPLVEKLVSEALTGQPDPRQARLFPALLVSLRRQALEAAEVDDTPSDPPSAQETATQPVSGEASEEEPNEEGFVEFDSYQDYLDYLDTEAEVLDQLGYPEED